MGGGSPSATATRVWKPEGKYTAQEIVGKLAYAYGLQPEPAPRTPESLIKDFSWAKVPKQDVCLPEDLF